ncbi:hypothetical protein BDV26DRAFT_255876 [Aspergillus bertholletiae]|uniref:Histone chaperone domain-containing protein n=1 Tax=Aspergillus bertholletiae TaxID=1226010 RepID=A0A5N7BHJ1_9EURO|nr:hypothetical protein BDV26DRAFT_255876 [Aspergillus bertholletiae]
MSNPYEREAEDAYEAQNDPSPISSDFSDNSYANKPGYGLKDQIPVQSDQYGFEDPVQPPYSNSDQQLAQDEREAVDRSNILRGDRLRHAKPQAQGYKEGEGEDEFR